MEQKVPRRLEQVALLRSAAGGNAAAVRTLMDEHLPIVYGFVLARLGGDEPAAEEIMQETLLEGVRSASTFRGESEISTWLCAIARRRIYRYFERERREEVAARGLEVVGADHEEDLARRDEVIRALGALPALHRQVLVLKYLDGLSVEEISEEIGRSGVQVQSLLQRAREGLRRRMEAARG